MQSPFWVLSRKKILHSIYYNKEKYDYDYFKLMYLGCSVMYPFYTMFFYVYHFPKNITECLAVFSVYFGNIVFLLIIDHFTMFVLCYSLFLNIPF